MRILYRLSDNGYKKPKLSNATKLHCLENFIWNVSWEFNLYLDKVSPETRAAIVDSDVLLFQDHDKKRNNNSIQVEDIPEDKGGSSAASWRYVRDIALSFSDDEIVYFVEDDYLHLGGSYRAIIEGLERADYISLYDAPDKYVPAIRGGNPLIPDSGGEDTQVILTKSSHWKLTNSTTMTFATTVKTLKEDLNLWKQFTDGPHPHDFQAFLALREKGRSLITPIPSLATHCEPAWLAPLIDWNKL